MIFKRQLRQNDTDHDIRDGRCLHRKNSTEHMIMQYMDDVFLVFGDKDIPENKLGRRMNIFGIHDNCLYNRQNTVLCFLVY